MLAGPHSPTSISSRPNPARALPRNESGRRLPSTAPAPARATSADFLKDGLAYIALLAEQQPELSCRLAPREPRPYGTTWVGPERTFAGAVLTGQAVGESRAIMSGEREAPFGHVHACAGGRVFGYITSDADERRAWWEQTELAGTIDAEVAFIELTPHYPLSAPRTWRPDDWPNEPDGHFGWPARGETVTGRIHLKNNGLRPIEPEELTLRAWVNTTAPNIDTLPTAGETATLTWVNEEAIRRFDATAVNYTVVEFEFAWPYGRKQPTGWSWERLTHGDTGPRFIVARLEYAEDRNERNDRYEAALDAALLRPVLAAAGDVSPLAPRPATVAGDPESQDYVGRKLADALQCLWARSGTTEDAPVWRPVTFVGYRVGWPATAAQDLAVYDAAPELRATFGVEDDFARFDAGDAGPVLRAAAAPLHRLDQLGEAWVRPWRLRAIRTAAGDALQLQTHCWAPDVFATGHTRIGPAVADLHALLTGTRYPLDWPWQRVCPERVFVRVLDHDGAPLPGATVTRWRYGVGGIMEDASGVTGADGRWDCGLPAGERSEFSPFGFALYDGAAHAAEAHILTIAYGDYADGAVLGADSLAAHGQLALLHAALHDAREATFDFPTLCRAGAPTPEFELRTAHRGRELRFRINGRPRALYRLYRRREPTYAFEMIEEAAAQRVEDRIVARFREVLGGRDWYTASRCRALYSVTEVRDGVESLPRLVHGLAIERANGLTDFGGGRLLATVNSGTANPFVLIADGTTPLEECARHPDPEHAAWKVVRSLVDPQRLYATVANGDGADGIAGFDVIQLDRAEPTALAPALLAARQSGADGAQVALRQPRGLDVIKAAEAEYIAIADSGNGRVVVWDAQTRFIAEWRVDGGNPVAVARHPQRSNQFFVLDRQASRQSRLYLLSFGRGRLTVEQGYPAPVRVGAADDGDELGLAAALDPSDDRVVVAITDASERMVYAMKTDLMTWKTVATLTRTRGAQLGGRELIRPTDVAFTLRAGELELYAVDGHDRIVRLK